MINRQEFLTEIPRLYPNTDEHLSFWRRERQRCIEGYWVSGYWMPGKLYFYCNYSTIKLNVQSSKVKSLGKPWLRDIEWNFFRLLEEARGFSGFIEDPFFSCHEALLTNLSDEEIISFYCKDEETGEIIDEKFYNIFMDRALTRKKYVSPRDYLVQQHPRDLGRPLYNNQSKNLMMIGARGFGKALDENHQIPLFEGNTKKLKDIVIGDIVIGDNGKPTKVLGVFPQGKRSCYEFTFSDGRKIVSDENHIWSVHKARRSKLYNLTTKEIVNSSWKYKHPKSGYSYRYSLPEIYPIDYSHKDFKIHPYVLGCLLGDGTLTTLTPKIASNDIEIIDRFRELLPWASLKKDSSNNNYTITKNKDDHGINVPDKRFNPLTFLLKEMGLNVSCKNKFIPEEYLSGSIEQRMELLRGLLDTDGSINKYGSIEFTSINKKLSEQVAYLCRSLGIYCKIGKDNRIGRVHKLPQGTNHVTNKVCYRVYIRTDKPVFFLRRKKSKLKKRKRSDKVSIVSIRKVNDRNTICLTVDNESKLFLVEGFIPTHNSYMMGGVVSHEYLFDGLTKYVPQKDTKTSSEVVVGAGDAKYSADTLEKVQLTLENLPGSIEINGKDFPSPFAKKYSGSWIPGKQIINRYRKKIGGNWKKVGNKSSIKHRTFKDNPFAANGTRPGIMLFEEVGLFDNLKQSYVASVECQRNGDNKFGTMIFIGCVCKGTKVYTNDGRVINIEDLKQEDGILGYDGSKAVIQTINHINPPQNKPCYRITTTGNNILECSYDHPLLKSGRKDLCYPNNKRTFITKFVEAEKLKVGDYLFFQDKVEIFGKEKIEDARLFGLLVGDGYSKDYVSLCIDDLNVRKYITSRYKTKVKKQFYTKENKVFSDLIIKGVKSKLKNNGMLGRVKSQKRFPTDIHKYDKQSLSEFIAGYFDADGNVYYNKKKNTTRIVLTSVVKQLLEEMKFQLMKFGIHCSIYKENRNTKAAEEYQGQQDYIYRLYISKDQDVLRFKENIPLLAQKKINTLKRIKIGNRNFGRPEFVRWEYDKNNKKGEDFFYKGGIDTFENLKFETITEIEYLGEKPVYNLNCSPTHTYLSNGFIHAQTGGDMSSGTRDAYEIFYNPVAYECLVLNDEWEHRGKIGFFVPAYLGLNQYKDSNGFTDIDKAKKYLEDHRRKLLSSGSTSALDGELINRPIKPSEIFLLKHGNIFPIHELQDRLAKIEQPEVQSNIQLPIYLYFDEKSRTGVNYKIDTKKKLRPINDFPYSGDDREGAVVVYELPHTNEDGTVPEGMYIIGHDPYSSDDPTGNSLASIYVLKTKKYLKHGHDQVVASFVGRPYHGRNVVNEHLLKLSMFYGNATIYFENATGNTKEYFEKHRKLHLLAKQPQTVMTKKAAYDGRSPVIYGYPMSSRQMKNQAIQYLRDWLLEERGIDEYGRITRNLDFISDKALLQELIAFNMDGNFDRVMGLAGCIIGMEETHNQYIEQFEEESRIDHAIHFFSTNKLFKKTYYAR